MESARLQPYFLLVLLVGAFALVFFILQSFLVPLIFAAIFAVIFQPLYLRLVGWVRGRQSIAAALATFLAVLCILLPLSLLGVQIAREASGLYKSLADGSGRIYVNQVVYSGAQLIDSLVPGTVSVSSNISSGIDDYAKQFLQWLISHTGSVFSSLSKLLLDLFVFILALYYLFRDGARLKATLIELSPFSDTDDERVFERLGKTISSVIKGNLTIAFIQGILCALGFTIFGVPNSILWGTVAMIGSLIPGVGTSLVLLPAIAFLYITGHAGASLGLFIWGAFAVGLIDNILGPKLVGSGSGLHPLLVLLSVLGGIGFFGPIGIFLGPISLALLFAFLGMYSNFAKVK